MTELKHKERPILMNAAMVRSVLDGSKTQTRRIVKMKPQFQIEERDDGTPWPWMHDGERDADYWMPCPFGQPGDRLYVRESARVLAVRGGIREIDIEYQADGHTATVHYPSRLAPAPLGKLLANGTYREASRILLEITDIRAERLQDISEKASLAEGIERSEWEYSCEPYRNYRKPSMAPGENCSSPKTSFLTLWESINGPGSWNANPWVWVVEFKVVKP